jgi:hypothetical protein
VLLRLRSRTCGAHRASVCVSVAVVVASTVQVKENQPALSAALKADLGVNDFWVDVSCCGAALTALCLRDGAVTGDCVRCYQSVELETCYKECKHVLEGMDAWVKPTHVGSPVLTLPASSYIVSWARPLRLSLSPSSVAVACSSRVRTPSCVSCVRVVVVCVASPLCCSAQMPEPYGVALIISPWNYPLSLILAPMAAAYAAGNVIVVKPSEVRQWVGGGCAVAHRCEAHTHGESHCLNTLASCPTSAVFAQPTRSRPSLGGTAWDD